LLNADRLDQTRQRLTGLWVGFTLAGIFRPNLLAGPGGRRSSLPRRLANLAADATLIALGARWWHEGVALLRRETASKGTAAEIELPPRIELERPALPGISIRS
jgi:hypothetical protein